MNEAFRRRDVINMVNLNGIDRHGLGGSRRGLMYVMEPLAPERGVATDQFAEAPGNRSFMVSFWIPMATASPGAVAFARRDPEVFMAKLFAEKRASVELLDSAYVLDSAGALVINATSRAEVAAILAEDPAIKADVVKFEVLGE
jgi:hypothetical protein